MKNNSEFKAVAFMRNARKTVTEKYQNDRTAFMNEMDEATKEFLKLRKKRKQSAHKKVA